MPGPGRGGEHRLTGEGLPSGGCLLRHRRGSEQPAPRIALIAAPGLRGGLTPAALAVATPGASACCTTQKPDLLSLLNLRVYIRVTVYPTGAGGKPDANSARYPVTR